jgi:hypothetical protein
MKTLVEVADEQQRFLVEVETDSINNVKNAMDSLIYSFSRRNFEKV